MSPQFALGQEMSLPQIPSVLEVTEEPVRQGQGTAPPSLCWVLAHRAPPELENMTLLYFALPKG